MTTDEILEQKWDALEDIPFNEIDNELILAENWWIFDEGDSREDIWRYFDDHHSKGVHYLLCERK